jgi:hypothetical protein
MNEILRESWNWFIYPYWSALKGFLVSPEFLYIALHVFFVTLLWFGFKIKPINDEIKEFIKNIFAATLISISAFWMFGVIVAAALQGWAAFSIPVLVGEAQCLLIILFSILLLIWPVNRWTWLWALLLFLFAIPTIATAVYIMIYYAIFGTTQFDYTSIKDILRWTLFGMRTLLFITVIQEIALLGVIFKEKARVKAAIKLFGILLVSNIIAGAIVQCLLLLVVGWR